MFWWLIQHFGAGSFFLYLGTTGSPDFNLRE